MSKINYVFESILSVSVEGKLTLRFSRKKRSSVVRFVFTLICFVLGGGGSCLFYLYLTVTSDVGTANLSGAPEFIET